MTQLRLYPTTPVKQQSFIGVKKTVVPMQALSLKEIIKRFVKNESLPVSKEGVYDDRYEYDLEKLAKEDITVQHEVIEEMKLKAKNLEIEIKKQEADKKDAMSKAASEQRTKLLAELNQQLQTPNSGIGGNASNGPRETEPRR